MGRPKHKTKTAIQTWILNKLADDPYLFTLVDIVRSKNKQAKLNASQDYEAHAYIATPWGAVSKLLAAEMIVDNWDSVWQRRMVKRA